MVGVWPCLRMFAIGLAMLTTVMAFDPHVINRLTWLTPYVAAAEELFTSAMHACMHEIHLLHAPSRARIRQGALVKLLQMASTPSSDVAC